MKLGLTKCVTLANDWLKECDGRHTACTGHSNLWPKRVIDVRGDMPRLVETETATRDLFEPPRYVTLSHCWGKTNFIKTTTNNLKERMAEIPWDDFPKSFQDAITLTRRIKCNSIWIDSLCIIQDDVDDWNEQASKMEDIYSNSFLNIAGTSRFAQSTGLFSIRECHSDPWRSGIIPAESHQITNDQDGSNRSVFARYNMEAGHRYIAGGAFNGISIAPLLTRAWVFQERLLAPRTIHFYASELIWECRSTLRCECQELDTISHRKASQRTFHSPLSPEDVDQSCKALFTEICQGGASPQAVLDFWLIAVSSYSYLGLTFEDDRLVALAGIAQRISAFIRSSYLAGLWAADLPRCLLWFRVGTRERKLSRSSKIAPTWSWASASSLIDYDCAAHYLAVLRYGFAKDERVEIHHSGILCDVPDENSFSTSKHGYIEITAAFINITINEDYELKLSSGEVLNYLSQDYDWTKNGPDQILPGEEAQCLLIGRDAKGEYSGHCLLLQQARDQVGYHKRIGSVHIDSPNIPIHFDDAKMTTVKII